MRLLLRLSHIAFRSHLERFATTDITSPTSTSKMSDLQELWAKLKTKPEAKSLLNKHLTDEVFEKLKDKKTALGGTLADCIRSGAKNLDSGVGVYACDPDAYDVFGDLFDEVIKTYHKVKKVEHPTPSLVPLEGDKDRDMPNIDPEGKYIVSTRIRTGRSQKGFSFPPTLENAKRMEMEANCKAAFEKLSDDLTGKYFPLNDMTKEQEKQLIDDHFLFKNDDRFLGDAGGYNDWPNGRGIFHNNAKTFLIWVNEEDHLRIISMQMGGDIAGVFDRLKRGIESMENSGMTFAKSAKLGNLTFCPTNLGTALRASVHMKIPHLSEQKDFKEICDKLNIQPRGIHGEHTESKGGVFDLSNKRRLGLTEFQLVKEMYDGVKEMLRLEKSLEK